jgi:RND superfamily putative drug exporter
VIGVGVLLDTFLGRTITVPAMATLVGQANWRSSRLSLRSNGRCHRRRPGRRSKVWFSPDA